MNAKLGLTVQAPCYKKAKVLSQIWHTVSKKNLTGGRSGTVIGMRRLINLLRASRGWMMTASASSNRLRLVVVSQLQTAHLATIKGSAPRPKLKSAVPKNDVQNNMTFRRRCWCCWRWWWLWLSWGRLLFWEKSILSRAIQREDTRRIKMLIRINCIRYVGSKDDLDWRIDIRYFNFIKFIKYF